MWNQSSLFGRRVVVTAGASSISLEIALAFASAGAKVLRDVEEAALARVATELPLIRGCRADV
jgi:NAD(P)-dependent dehydrogenase (short-subunit alcohol dehydrogenase family)